MQTHDYSPAFHLLKMATSPITLRKLRPPEELITKMAYLPAATHAACLRDGVYRNKSPELMEAALYSAVLDQRPLEEIQQLLNIASQARLPVSQLINQLQLLASDYPQFANSQASAPPEQEVITEYFRELRAMISHFPGSQESSSEKESIWETGTFSYRGVIQSSKVDGTSGLVGNFMITMSPG